MPILPRKLADDLFTKVRYFSRAERAASRLYVRDGLLYDAAGNLFDTGGGRAIFVADRRGNLYASLATRTKSGRRIKHSSFRRGKRVAAAGEMGADQGQLLVMTPESGHYETAEWQIDQLLALLGTQGVDVDRVQRIVMSFKGSRWRDQPGEIRKVIEQRQRRRRR